MGEGLAVVVHKYFWDPELCNPSCFEGEKKHSIYAGRKWLIAWSKTDQMLDGVVTQIFILFRPRNKQVAAERR